MLRCVCACGSCVVSLCIVLCHVVVGVLSSARAARRACGGVPPGNQLGGNAGSAIGKALEKNTALVELNLSSAPACVLALRLSSVYFSRLCASVFTRLLSIRPVSCVLLQVRCMLMCDSGLAIVRVFVVVILMWSVWWV